MDNLSASAHVWPSVDGTSVILPYKCKTINTKPLSVSIYCDFGSKRMSHSFR